MLGYFVLGLVLVLAFLVLLGRLSRTQARSGRKNIIFAILPVGFVLLAMLAARGQILPAAIAALAAIWMVLTAKREVRYDSSEKEAAARLLGVATDAGKDEINAAYRRLMAEHHPDKGGDSEMAAKLNAARNCLLGK